MSPLGRLLVFKLQQSKVNVLLVRYAHYNARILLHKILVGRHKRVIICYAKLTHGVNLNALRVYVVINLASRLPQSVKPSA